MKEILSERVIQEQGSYKRVERYYKGHHPELGQLTIGYTGEETIAHEDVIKPVITVNVLPTVESLWEDTYEYPMQWSRDLSTRDDELGEIHKNRIEVFERTIYERTTE